jgi:hypothetical protein
MIGNVARLGMANSRMTKKSAGLAGWTPEQIAQGKRCVEAWKEAALVMEQLRRLELRRLDAKQAIGFLCGPADYRIAPRAPKPTSGLVEQQRWFMRAASRE